MVGDEKRQTGRRGSGTEPVEPLATIIPRLLALRGLLPVAEAANAVRAEKKPRPTEMIRIAGVRAV